MVDKSRLVVLVEGNRDLDFVEWIIKPVLLKSEKYIDIIPYKFSRIPKKINESYIENVIAMKDDILCLTDITGFPCKTTKKEQVQRDHIGYIGNDKVIIVVREIESWYLAGANKACCKKMKIVYYNKTDDINKEKFHEIISKSKYKPKYSCLLEILHNYEIQLARQRNKSFNYFYKHHFN